MQLSRHCRPRLCTVSFFALLAQLVTFEGSQFFDLSLQIFATHFFAPFAPFHEQPVFLHVFFHVIAAHLLSAAGGGGGGLGDGGGGGLGGATFWHTSHALQ